MAGVRIERKSDYIVKQAVADDEEEIKSFLGRHIWKNRDADSTYQWKYRNNPRGDTLAFIGVNSENNVIATSFFMPWRLWLNGRYVNSHQWVDVLVHLEYRGQSIPSEILHKSLSKARQEGSQVCFAFPNNNGVPVHKKNNGIHLGNIVRHTKPLNATYLVKRYVKWEFLTKIAGALTNFALKLASKETFLFNSNRFLFERVDKCGEEFDNLWNRINSRLTGKVIASKDSAYLNWKYAASPNKKRYLYSLKRGGDIEGFVVMESDSQTGYIVDILAAGKDALHCLIAYSIRQFRKQNKDSVVFIALENNAYEEEFRKFGFMARPDVKNFYIYLDEKMEDRERFLDSRNWFVTIGDCDIEGL